MLLGWLYLQCCVHSGGPRDRLQRRSCLFLRWRIGYVTGRGDVRRRAFGACHARGVGYTNAHSHGLVLCTPLLRVCLWTFLCHPPKTSFHRPPLPSLPYRTRQTTPLSSHSLPIPYIIAASHPSPNPLAYSLIITLRFYYLIFTPPSSTTKGGILSAHHSLIRTQCRFLTKPTSKFYFLSLQHPPPPFFLFP